MTSVSVSSPGKAVLSGEYAVLRQAPAISTAVDCRAVARLVATPDSFHCVATPGHADGRWRFTANSAGEIDWLDEPPAGGLRLIEAAWLAIAPRVRGGLSITVDTSGFFATDSHTKLGLGSSAAAMTALIGALCELDSGNNDIVILANKAHVALQQGLGSGVDIATSIQGGVIEYRMGNPGVQPHYSWPDGLYYRFLWSGEPADTVSKIGKFETVGSNDESISALVAASEAAASAWAAGDTAEILSVFRRYTDTLRQFSIDHDLGIFDAGHDKMTGLAASCGVVYKPCGAGGGDIGIVLASDKSAMIGFCAQAMTNGFQQLAVALDRNGVRVSVEDER